MERDNLKPKFFEAIQNFTVSRLYREIFSGLSVALFYLPIALTLAILSGGIPAMGLYAAALAGLCVALFGGSSVCIGGPIVAFTSILFAVRLSYSLDGYMVVTIMAGLILLIMGFLRLGSVIKFVPYTITISFTFAIAIILFIDQAVFLFGLNPTMFHGEPIAKLLTFLDNLDKLNIIAILITAFTVAIYFAWKKFIGKIPIASYIVSIIFTSVIVAIFGLRVDTVGKYYQTVYILLTATEHIPTFSLALVRDLFPTALAIAIIASISSSLNAVVADGITGDYHNPNSELVGIGIANVLCGLFGGIPTSISKHATTTNIESGGRTPIAGVFASIFIYIISLRFIEFIKYIPLATLSGIMITIAIEMVDWQELYRLIKNSSTNTKLIFFVTFAMTMLLGVVITIEIGLVILAFTFMSNVSKTVFIRKWESSSNGTEDYLDLPSQVEVVDIIGPLFFASASKLASIKFDEGIKVLIFRMGSVPDIDESAIHALRVKVANAQINGITVVLSHVHDNVYSLMEKEKLIDAIGEQNIRPSIKDAIEYSKNII